MQSRSGKRQRGPNTDQDSKLTSASAGQIGQQFDGEDRGGEKEKDLDDETEGEEERGSNSDP